MTDQSKSKVACLSPSPVNSGVSRQTGIHLREGPPIVASSQYKEARRGVDKVRTSALGDLRSYAIPPHAIRAPLLSNPGRKPYASALYLRPKIQEHLSSDVDLLIWPLGRIAPLLEKCLRLEAFPERKEPLVFAISA